MYYFEFPDSENCFTIDHFIEQMNENYISEMEVYPARIQKVDGYFWCAKWNEIGETKESCGQQCSEYSPRNGKNGRCRYHKNCYEPLDESIKITIIIKVK